MEDKEIQEGGDNQAPVDPEVLSSLGLTPEDVANFDKAVLERKAQVEEAKKEGTRLYEELTTRGFRETYVGRLKVSNTRMNTVINRSNLPDAAYEAWGKERQSWHPSNISHQEATMPAFFEGYGTAALANKDWRAAVSAFDNITEGGIMNSPTALEGLRTITQEDKTTGVEIAKEIQRRVEVRKQTPPPLPENPVPQNGPET